MQSTLSPIATPDDLTERLLAGLARTHTLIAPLKTQQRWDDALCALGGIFGSSSRPALLHDPAAAEVHRALLALLCDSSSETVALILTLLEAQELPRGPVPDHLLGLCEDLLALQAVEPHQTEELVRLAISHAHLTCSVRDDAAARESVGAEVDPRLDKMLKALLRLSTSPRSPSAWHRGSATRLDGMQSSPARRHFPLPASPLGGWRKRTNRGGGAGGYLARGLAPRSSPDRRLRAATRFVEPLAGGGTVVMGHRRGRIVF